MNRISKLAFDANVTSCALDCCPLQDVPLAEMPTDVALLTAGWPCTPYSKSGRQGGRDDSASFVFDWIVERAAICRPRWLVMENVPDVLTAKMPDGASLVWNELQRVAQLHLPGYRCKWQKYNTRVHSDLPQNRERVYFVWFREQADWERFSFPVPTPEKRLVSDLLQPEAEVADEFYYATRESRSWFQQHMRTAQLQTVRETQTVCRRWERDVKPMVGSVPCLQANATITSNSLPVVRDARGNRMLTPLECFRLQGFSDEWVRGLPPELTHDDRYFLAGNAVSLPVAELVVAAVLQQQAVLAPLPTTESSRFLSVLGYPGSKRYAVHQFRAIQQQHFPGAAVCYSPFLGGGSFELHLNYLGLRIHANDGFKPLIRFWLAMQEDRDAVFRIIHDEERYPVSRERFHELCELLSPDRIDCLSTVYAGAYFLILNKESYSSGTMSGGFRDDWSTLAKLRREYFDQCGPLTNFSLSCQDVFAFLETVPKDDARVFLFLDPPYVKAEKRRYYGYAGSMNKNFPHEKLRDALQAHPCWMLCYDDCPLIRTLYSEHVILEPKAWKYSLNNGKDKQQGRSTEGQELVILSTKHSC